MIVKVLFCFTFLGTVLSSPSKGYNNFPELESQTPFFELPCITYGGVCMQENDCPAGKNVGVKGLCPVQQEQGVECCYSATSKSATTCRSHGGECMSLSWNCPKNLLYRATDCAADEHCCIVVNK